MLFVFTLGQAQTVLINPNQEGGFELGNSFADNGWTTVNASTNTWAIGNVPAWQTGTNSAFVTNNGGGAWAYTATLSQASHFYRDIAFPAGETNITLTFDWRGNGNDGNYDNLQVYVTDLAITPNTAGPTSTGTTTTGWTGYTNGTNGYYLTRINGTTTPTTTTAVSYTFTTAQATFCAGTTKRLIFTWKNDGSFGSNPPASVDNISLVTSCSGPSAIAATAVQYNSFQANWNALTDAIGYALEYRATGATNWTPFQGNPVNGTSAVISGLTAGTTYQYRVSALGAVCNTPSNIISATPTCPLPTGITSSLVTINSATISWNAPANAPGNGYFYEVRTSGAAGSGATGLVTSGTTLAGVTSAQLSSLTPATSYSVYVRSSCDASTSSNWTSAFTLKTSCLVETAPTLVENFSTATGSSPSFCWSEATGVLSATPTLVAANSEWLASTGFANTGTNVGIKTNLYSSGNEWLISQAIDLGTTTDFRLKYDMAVTSYNGLLAQTTLGTHKVDVLISTDGGTTWSNANILKTYTGAGSYSNTGATETISLAAYTGVIKIAFVATTTSTSPDIDFHIDNFVVEEIPSCAEPTSPLALATTATTATISWTAPSPAPAGGYEYEIRTSGAAGSGATGLTTNGVTAAGVLTTNITGLTANTNYTAYIRSNCGGGALSPWISKTFFTGYCTPAPSSVDASGITNVSVGTINNTTVAETGNYGDYTALSTDLTIGAPDTVRITYATGYTYGTKIWIDFNNDLDFTDAGELIYSGLSSFVNPTTLKANFIIPVGAPQGLHRMRIGGTDNDAGPSDACYTGAYGTFEDYTVNIVCPTTILAPTAPVGDIVCATQTADLAITGISGASLSWYNAATAGTLVNSDDTYTTDALAATTSYWVEQSFTGCSAISPRTEVIAIVTPVNLTLTPIDNTCNGYAAGSFALGTVNCGTAPFEYSVNGGAFGAIPTNLAAGTYSIIVRDAALGLSQPISVVVGEPSTVIPTPITANTSVCEDATSKIVTAQPSVFNTGSVVVSFDLAAQPTEAIGAANTDTIATAVMQALPAGAIITSVTMTMPGITALGTSWQADIRLGAAGAILNTAAAGTGAANGAGAFNYTRTLPNSSVNAAGGTVYLTYWDNVDDNVSAPESTFPIGTGVATITVQYNLPDVNSISWWTAPTGGTQLGTAPTLETVGTSVLPSPAATGTYTFYAQTTKNGCNSVTRSPLVVTVLNNPEPVITASNPVLCNGSSIFLISSSATGNVWSTSATATNDSLSVNAAGSYTVTVTDANGCVGTSAPYVTTITALPVVSAGTDQTVCANSNVTLVGSGTPTLTWNNNVTNNTPFVATATNSYIVTGTAANGCVNRDTVTVTVNALPVPVIAGDLAICSGDSTLLVASAATGIVWSTSPTATNDSIYVDAAGSYTVTQTDANGCVGTSAPAVVTINALPTINAGADIAVCQNGQAILFATGGQTYTWTGNITNGVSFVATATNSYVVTGTDANGCMDKDTVVVTVNPLPTVEAGANQTLCGSGSVTLTATGATVYSWNNGVVNGTPFTAPVGTNVYVVTGIDALGCANTDVVTVTVNNVPVATATAANQLTIVASPAGMSYQWIDCATNTPILGANNQTFTATENGSYKVIVTGMGGCADTSACVNINSVGLENNQADLGISLYPNPTTGNVFVNMPATEEATITVFDAQGKVVMTLENAQNGSVIELSEVQYGMYMIQVANANGSNTFRIVKN